MPLTLKPATGSGQMTLISVAGTTTSDTLTLPAKTGNIITSADTGTVTQTMLGTNVAGNGPMAFAYTSANQTISSSTWTKVNFDTASTYGTATNGWDTTNKRFKPTVAGYYFVTGFVYNTGNWTNQSIIGIYKNGSIETRTYDTYGAVYGMPVNALVYLNGSTDYLEIYVYSSGAGLTIYADQTVTFIRCSLLRAA